MELIEGLLRTALPDRKLPAKFETISFDDAMRFYGCDKPDTRFEMKIEADQFFEQYTLDFQPYGISNKKVKKMLAELSKNKEFDEKYKGSKCRIGNGNITANTVEILGEIRTQLAKRFLDLDK